MNPSDKALVVFQGKKIRRTWFNDEWWFSVVDIVEALTESGRARKYWSDLKKRLTEEGFELSAKIGQLKLISADGKSYQTDCVNTKNAFRIIQSIPSKKAEPFKQWLAQVGYERVQEIENPELAQKRMKEIYKAKGYSDDWIEKRVRGIAIRDELALNPFAKSILDVAVRESILQRRNTDYTPKTPGGPRLPTYMLNRRLAPRRNLGIRMQGRIEIRSSDIDLAATDRKNFMKLFGKVKVRYPRQTGPGLFPAE